jgi:uncharacterized protein
MQDTAQIPEVIPYQYQFIVKPERSPVERRLAHFRVCMIVWGKCMIGRVVTPSGTETTLSHPSFAVAGGFAAATAYAAVITAAHLTSHGALPIMAVFVGATLGAIAGFAFVPLCAVPLLDLLGTPADVMLVLLVCSIANQTLTVAMLWRSIDWRRLAPILLTGAAGSPVGLLLLRHCNLHWYTLAFGAWLILYCLVTMFRPQVVTEQTDWTGDLVAGFLGGVCGGFLATPSVPISIRIGRKGLDKTAQRAIYQPFILAIQIVTLTLIGGHDFGRASLASVDPLALICLPVSLLGTCCGLKLFHHLTDHQFARVVTALLGIAGTIMIFQ